MKVAIFFGSKSDTEKMKKAADVLKEFSVDYKAYIISAHRAGELLRDIVHKVEKDGCEVIIAGAGLAAALPGVIAGITTIPVIGVPLECISTNSNGLGGMDSLLSIVQMPPQIPVAAVGIGNAKNAGYLSVQIKIRKKIMASYKESGVDVEEGYRAVSKYKEHAKKTAIPGLLTGLGSFNGRFEIPKGYKNPIMVSGTDGVGTKLDIAFQMKKYDTVGIDCVAMSVNDILCSGVQTSFFLDYIACGKLDAQIAGDLVKGVADGCLDAECALLGGETAEMPGFYDDGKYDLAGFGVGIGEKEKIITGDKIEDGDVLIGLSSTGCHSNGYSLVRKLVKDFNDPFFLYGTDTGKTIGEVLLTPTRIYVRPVMHVLEKYRKSVHGMVHITGGGFYENIPRMYPKAKEGGRQLISVIKRSSWDIPPVFGELIKRGADVNNVYSTFNMGIGFVLAVKAADADAVTDMFNKHASKFSKPGIPDMKAYQIGR